MSCKFKIIKITGCPTNAYNVSCSDFISNGNVIVPPPVKPPQIIVTKKPDGKPKNKITPKPDVTIDIPDPFRDRTTPKPPKNDQTQTKPFYKNMMMIIPLAVILFLVVLCAGVFYYYKSAHRRVHVLTKMKFKSVDGIYIS